MIRVSWNTNNYYGNLNHNIKGYKVHVGSSSSFVSQHVNCYSYSVTDGSCLVMLNELRQSPYNIGSGQTISLQVIALGFGCDSAPSSTVTTTMTNSCTSSCSPFIKTAFVPVDTSSADDEPVNQGNDLPVDLGLDKQASNDDAKDDSSAASSDSGSDSINLKAKNVESGFISGDEETETEQP